MSCLLWLDMRLSPRDHSTGQLQPQEIFYKLPSNIIVGVEVKA